MIGGIIAGAFLIVGFFALGWVLRSRACNEYFDELRGKVDSLDYLELENRAELQERGYRPQWAERDALLHTQKDATWKKQIWKFWRKPESFYDLEALFASPLDYWEKED